MGGFGPNRPKTTMREKKEWGKKREAKQRSAPTGQQEGNNLRCNTDPQTRKKEQERITEDMSQVTHKTTKRMKKSHNQRQQSHGEGERKEIGKSRKR